MSEDLKDTIEFVGSITPQDIEDGSVLIFRINDARFPKAMMSKVVASIQQSVTDLFQGQVKAIIVPDFIEVTTLKELAKEKIINGQSTTE
jgi:hypothetical protein